MSQECSEWDRLGHIKLMMAANYHDRMTDTSESWSLVTGFVSEEVVTGLFFDIGSSAEIAIWDLLAEKTLLCIAVNLRQSTSVWNQHTKMCLHYNTEWVHLKHMKIWRSKLNTGWYKSNLDHKFFSCQSRLHTTVLKIMIWYICLTWMMTENPF